MYLSIMTANYTLPMKKMRPNKIILIFLSIILIFSAGCIAEEKTQLPQIPQPTSIPDENYQQSNLDYEVKNFTHTVDYWNSFYSWGLTPEEISKIGNALKETHSDNIEDRWYRVNNNELMKSIGKSAGLSENEIESFISDVNYLRVVMWEGTYYSYWVETTLNEFGTPEFNAKVYLWKRDGYTSNIYNSWITDSNLSPAVVPVRYERDGWLNVRINGSSPSEEDMTALYELLKKSALDYGISNLAVKIILVDEWNLKS